MKMPAFQFYPADWRKDPGVQALDFHDRGVWFEILCIMHESDERGVLLLNGRPMPEPALARMLGLDNQILTTTLTNLVTYGVASRRESDGALVSRRMVKDEALCQVRREAGKKGGNPSLVKQKPTTGDNQKPTPSSSSSTSSSKTADAVVGEQAAGSSPSAESSTQLTGQKGGGPREFYHDEAPVFQMNAFFAFVDSIGYKHVDKGMYLLQIQAVGREKMIHTTDEKWRAFIRTWLNNDKRDGKLILPAPEGQQQQAYNPQLRITGNPTSSIAAGNLTERIQAQQKQEFIL
jgi:hypothetical protein